MNILQLLRLPAVLLAGALLITGCDGFDSGAPPTEATDGETAATVSFTEGGFSAVESADSISTGVTINNPPGREVSVEVLYANGASATDPSDFGLTNSEQVGAGRLAGTVVFPDTATTGNTQTIRLGIADDEENEPREEGIFALQNVQNATIGQTNRLAVTIGAIRVFFEDFSSGLGAFTPVTLQSVTTWETGSEGSPPPERPYAVASGFQDGDGVAADDWLISPSFNFNVLEQETLSFQNAFGFSDQIRGLRVKVSTDYDGGGDSTSVASATWTDVSDQVTFSDGNFNFVGSGDVDLSAAEFQSESTYIAFQYVSSGTASGQAKDWQIDNVALTSSTQPPEGE